MSQTATLQSPEVVIAMMALRAEREARSVRIEEVRRMLDMLRSDHIINDPAPGVTSLEEAGVFFGRLTQDGYAERETGERFTLFQNGMRVCLGTLKRGFAKDPSGFEMLAGALRYTISDLLSALNSVYPDSTLPECPKPLVREGVEILST